MGKPLPTPVRNHLTGLRLLLVFTVLLGLAYPLLMTGIGQGVFHHQANGSLVKVEGKVVGSSLLGQNFELKNGKPDPRWFQPRPSAAGESGYDGASSTASNLGPNDPGLTKTVKQRKAEVAAFNGVSQSQVPPDAVTASGSGLDPDISPQYAAIQVDRVAKARGVDASKVRALVARYTQGRDAGFLGEPRVDVLELNIALQKLS
ncbi:potassium-transporting ATPase subunit KdpC [Phaeacidiphilus oryzae]|uniref:potassium-transporting ATPase subunit KdpC n=1 Tax=Phaeacidiphilus oryzae TaxID=348818 RepID=UPI0006898EA4|nr:potassium-transporting ATPase subunit KdpC [Phaeacidiphilus oryzae]